MIDVASTIEGVQLPIIAQVRIGVEELLFSRFIHAHGMGSVRGREVDIF